MNFHKDNLFGDLDEGPLSNKPTSEIQGAGTHAAAYQQEHDNAAVHGYVERKTIEEKCPKCQGRGRFISYTGRDVGPCHTCKGKGVLYFSRTQDERAKARDQRHKREAQKRVDNLEAFASNFSAEHAWLVAHEQKSNFAASLLDAVRKYGYLTEAQAAAVGRCIAKDAERAAEAQKRVEAAPTVDMSTIKTVLDRAHSRGLKNPSLRFTEFTFQRAGDASKNPGAVYVVGADKSYYGKITPEGKLLLRREAESHTNAILAVAADPQAAADLHGQQTGCCACCGKELTREESVQRGIGPICWAKYFG